MRGIATGTGEFRIDSLVSVYKVDHQPMTAISQQPDVRLIHIERVEALPGPQGTLFGSSSLEAGTLHYVTNKPDVSGYSRARFRRRSARPQAAIRVTTSVVGSISRFPTILRCAGRRVLVGRRRVRGQCPRPDAVWR